MAAALNRRDIATVVNIDIVALIAYLGFLDAVLFRLVALGDAVLFDAVLFRLVALGAVNRRKCLSSAREAVLVGVAQSLKEFEIDLVQKKTR